MTTIKLCLMAIGGAAALAAAATVRPANAQQMPPELDELLSAARGSNEIQCGFIIDGIADGWNDRSRPRSPDYRRVKDWLREERLSDAAVESLGNSIGDQDTCVQRVSTRILGHDGRERAVQLLVRALNRGGTAAPEAAIALGVAHARDAVPDLLEALASASSPLRSSAAWALGHIEDPRALDPLIGVMRDDEVADVRAAAAEAIGELF